MTSDQTGPTKAELLTALRANGEDTLTHLRAVPPEAFEQGRYENGWNGRQILAHVASIEWTYRNLIDIAAGSDAPAKPDAGVTRTEPGEAAGTPTRTMRGGVGSYNERQVAKREGASVDELLAEFERNREQTIAAVEAAGEELFARQIRSAGGITGSLANVIQAVAVLHVAGHVNDIVGG